MSVTFSMSREGDWAWVATLDAKTASPIITNVGLIIGLQWSF
jgi:hypothetical protein